MFNNFTAIHVKLNYLTWTFLFGGLKENLVCFFSLLLYEILQYEKLSGKSLLHFHSNLPCCCDRIGIVGGGGGGDTASMRG